MSSVARVFTSLKGAMVEAHVADDFSIIYVIKDRFHGMLAMIDYDGTLYKKYP